MEFTVKLDRYEGPYTKLLELLEQKKLSITEISLVEIADDYIAFIKSIDQKSLIDISQFILVASTLMLMKAKSLLPGLSYAEEEEKQIHDLENKLELYSILVSANKSIRSIYMKNQLYSRERVSYKGESIFIPDKNITKDILQSIVQLTLASFIVPKQFVKVEIEQMLRIENVIERLFERVKTMKSVTLQSLADGAKTEAEKKKILIVNFIAILELLRSGSIRASQNANGEDIQIEHVTNPELTK